jgi:hypothetical protein
MKKIPKIRKLLRTVRLNFKHYQKEYDDCYWGYYPSWRGSKPTYTNGFVESYNYFIKRHKDKTFNRLNTYFKQHTNFDKLPF